MKKMQKWHDAEILRQYLKVVNVFFLYKSCIYLFPVKLKSKWSALSKLTRMFTNGAIEVERK